MVNGAVHLSPSSQHLSPVNTSTRKQLKVVNGTHFHHHDTNGFATSDKKTVPVSRHWSRCSGATVEVPSRPSSLSCPSPEPSTLASLNCAPHKTLDVSPQEQSNGHVKLDDNGDVLNSESDCAKDEPTLMTSDDLCSQEDEGSLSQTEDEAGIPAGGRVRRSLTPCNYSVKILMRSQMAKLKEPQKPRKKRNLKLECDESTASKRRKQRSEQEGKLEQTTTTSSEQSVSSTKRSKPNNNASLATSTRSEPSNSNGVHSNSFSLPNSRPDPPIPLYYDLDALLSSSETALLRHSSSLNHTTSVTKGHYQPSNNSNGRYSLACPRHGTGVWCRPNPYLYPWELEALAQSASAKRLAFLRQIELRQATEQEKMVGLSDTRLKSGKNKTKKKERASKGTEIGTSKQSNSKRHLSRSSSTASQLANQGGGNSSTGGSDWLLGVEPNFLGYRFVNGRREALVSWRN